MSFIIKENKITCLSHYASNTCNLFSFKNGVIMLSIIKGNKSHIYRIMHPTNVIYFISRSESIILDLFLLKFLQKNKIKNISP
jgi:hypothetical protein